MVVLGGKNCLGVTLGAQLSCCWILLAVIWQDLWDQGPADVLMQDFQIRLVHSRDVKHSNMLLTWRTQHSLVWRTRFHPQFTYSQTKVWYCTLNFTQSFSIMPAASFCLFLYSKVKFFLLFFLYHSFFFLLVALGTWTLSPSKSVEIVF